MDPIILETDNFFSKLPDFWFDLLISYFDFETQQLLWRCNNKDLISRLKSKYGLKTVILQQTTSKISKLRFPSFLNQLCFLSTLIIVEYESHSFKSFGISVNQMESLPASLTRLHFDFLAAEKCFLKPTLLPGLKVPEHLEFDIDRLQHYETIDYLDLNKILPNLKTLFLSGNEFLENDFVPKLPIGLLDLTLQENDNICSIGIQNMPKNLKRLILPINTHIKVQDVAKLENLEELQLSSFNNSHSSYNTKLPNTIKKLCISQVTKDISKVLPDSLECFSAMICSNLNQVLISDLPRSLTFLHLPFTHSLTNDMIDSLSVDLKTLSLGGNHDKPISFARFKNLQKLELRANISLSNADIAILPRKLTHLESMSSLSLDDDIGPHLPRNLIHLSLYSNRLTGAFLKYLPKTMTTLYLHSIMKVHDEDIKDLPRNLLFLKMQNAVLLTNACLTHLPIYLKNANFGNNRNFVNVKNLLPNTYMVFTSIREKINLVELA